jgi:hypothetical protein
MYLTRQYRRFRVADLHGTLQFAHPAVVLDLSRSGIAVESAERLVPGRTYPLQLEGRDGLLITTSARVVWCKLTGTCENEDGEAAPVYRAGLEFQGVLPEAAGRLFDELEASTVEDVGINLRARYKLSDLASTLLLRGQSTFDVRTMSRNGMGAEMEYSPRVGSMLEFVLPLDEPLELRGRVADVNPAAENPTRFLVGIEFVSVPPLAQGRIDRYLESLRAKLTPASRA